MNEKSPLRIILAITVYNLTHSFLSVEVVLAFIEERDDSCL